MIKPTVGRKVWFWSSLAQYHRALEQNFDHELLLIDSQPQDATIVAVWSPSMINLHVIDHTGLGRSETSVQLMQEGDPFPEGRFATWMPFQIGQAKAQAGEMKC